MVDDPPHGELGVMLEEAFLGHDRLSRDEIRRRAIVAGLSAEQMARVEALPEGEYSLDEAAEALRVDVDI